MRKSLSIFALLIAVSALPATVDAAAVENASVERLDDGTYKVVWITEPAKVPVTVEMAAAPDAAEFSRIAAGTAEGTVIATPGAEFGRPYFRLTPKGGEAMLVAERTLKLEGGWNFRDIGGYRTADGRVTRWGRLYRSGALYRLTDGDYAYLRKLGIRVVCDLRSADERQSEPTRWQGDAIQTIAVDYRTNSAALLGDRNNRPTTPDDMRRLVAGAYRQMPKNLAPAFTEMFKRIADGELPLTLHCSAGKDRTGLGTALVLSALGVPRDVIMADYLLSDKVVDFEAILMKAVEGQDNPGARFLAMLPPEMRKPLLDTHPSYLEAAFAQIEQDHGSVDAYLRDAVGVTPEMLDRVRTQLLQ